MKKISKILFVMFLFLFSVGFSNKALASGTTWNPNDKGSGVTLSNNNLTTFFSGPYSIRSTNYKTEGKWYWEVQCDDAPQGYCHLIVGVANEKFNINDCDWGSYDQFGYYGATGAIEPADKKYGEPFNKNDTIGIALDLTEKKLTFYKNNKSQGTLDISRMPGTKFYPYLGFGNKVTTMPVTFTTSFDKTTFKYTPPEGFLALDDNNLNQNIILNMEPEKNKIKLNETVSANLTIDNIKDIAAEDVRIKYDSSKLQFLGAAEVDGIKLVKNDAKDGELRLILASKGVSNVVEAKKVLLKLNFKGIAAGDALVDVTKGRVSDGIEMEKDLTDTECGKATITIDNEALVDVNKDGQFTLLDLGIDGRHYSEDPAALPQYNTDIVVNRAIDDDDLTKIGEYMLANPNYKF